MRHAALCALLACVWGTSAQAEDCGPLQQIASVPMTPEGLRVTVPVTLNGTPQTMTVSTAGDFTSLNATAVDALHLSPIDDNGRVRLLDRAGNASRKIVIVHDLRIGNIAASDVQLMLQPNPGAGGNVAGVLAGDVMRNYDIEMDFAAQTMNFFSQKHCDGHVVYWPHTGLAVIPMTMGMGTHGDPLRRGSTFRPFSLTDTHVRVPVTLDGKDFMAVISTTGRSVMSAATAKYVFGLAPDSSASVPLGNNGGQPIYGHAFSSLTLDGVTVKNPHIVILPDLVGAKDPDNGLQTGSRIARDDDNAGPPAITIGMDVLRQLHVYFAYGERKLYITEASALSQEAKNH